MLAMGVIGLINVWLILKPPRFFTLLLELMEIPTSARFTFLLAVVVNVAISMAYESWGITIIASLMGYILESLRNRKRIRDGKAYKAIENGMS